MAYNKVNNRVQIPKSDLKNKNNRGEKHDYTTFLKKKLTNKVFIQTKKIHGGEKHAYAIIDRTNQENCL